MPMRNLLFILFLIINSASALSSVIKEPTNFTTIGKISTFQWAPDFYESEFKYDIFYYIPERIANNQNVRSLVFLHGGGTSTVTRDGSIAAVNKYINDLKKLADSLGVIVIAPSANGLNWGGHMRSMLKELTILMNKELKLDPQRIGLSGHSMGGMGITRTYMWVSDLFGFIMPLSAGMDELMQSEENLNKVFNVPYVHLQGVNDHFDIFIQRCQAQLKNTQNLEKLYEVPSKLTMMFFEGNHNYDLSLVHSNLKYHFDEKPRDLYQRQLWGSLYMTDKAYVERGIKFVEKSNSRYFWVEAIKFDATINERIDFRAKVTGQSVHLDLFQPSKTVKTIRVYLHSSMINLNKKVKIYLNGIMVEKFRRYNKNPPYTDPKDPGFIFDTYVDINLE